MTHKVVLKSSRAGMFVCFCLLEENERLELGHPISPGKRLCHLGSTQTPSKQEIRADAAAQS